ncbi:MAG TPA: thiolase family protein [Candidatus Polarisedimenticolia bacterium]|nr:thiolase family protein [Candidatus Polarisedimenticolia bacterium]
MSDRRAVVIVEGVRTPFCKAWGVLKEVPADELCRIALGEAMSRVDLDPAVIDEVIIGNIAQPAETTTLARVAALKAGVPRRVPAFTINQNCGSGLQAIVTAYHRIESGLADVVIAGGVESMSRIPFLLPERFTDRVMDLRRARHLPQRLAALLRFRRGDVTPVSALEVGLRDALCGLNMGETAEVLARRYHITREEQDAFALESHKRAVAARPRLREEIVPVFPPPRLDAVQDDVGPREDQSLEALTRLKPAFDRRYGTVTAGNSCMLTDGAACVIVASEEKAHALGLPYLGRIRSYGFAGLDPATMGLGPVHATAVALRRAQIGMEDLQLFEINEAFAAQVLAVRRAFASAEYARDELGLAAAIGEPDPERTNVNGGAIALGHPVGCSGARLALTLLREMARRDLTLGLATLCIGGGQGAALILERS